MNSRAATVRPASVTDIHHHPSLPPILDDSYAQPGLLRSRWLLGMIQTLIP